MWIIGQSGRNALDALGFDTKMFTDESKNVTYGIVAFGFSFQMIIAQYSSLEMTEVVLKDILNSLIKGTTFYDLKDRESKLL